MRIKVDMKDYVEKILVNKNTKIWLKREIKTNMERKILTMMNDIKKIYKIKHYLRERYPEHTNLKMVGQYLM